MTAADAVKAMIREIDKRVGRVAPFRAVVDSLSAGKVLILREGAVANDDQAYARIAGFDLAAADEVLCVNLGGQPIVLGKIQRSTPSSLAVPYLANTVYKVDRDNTNFTNTDTANDADAVSTTITLPTGTWSIHASGGVTAFHSSTGGITVALSLNASVGATSTAAAGPTAGDRYSVTAVNTVTGVSSGTITCKVVFHSVTAGTSTVDTSWLFIVAQRTA